MPFILLYWKQILIGVLMVGLLGMGYWFKSVIAERDAQRVQIIQKDKEIADFARANEKLSEAVNTKTLELQKYIKLNAKLSADKKQIQSEYDMYLKRIKDEKPTIIPGIGITEPYILLNPGVLVGPSSNKGANNP